MQNKQSLHLYYIDTQKNGNVIIHRPACKLEIRLVFPISRVI